MKLAINLDKDDINTFKCGNNMAIRTGDLMITFTPEAVDELIADFENIKAGRLEGYVHPGSADQPSAGQKRDKI